MKRTGFLFFRFYIFITLSTGFTNYSLSQGTKDSFLKDTIFLVNPSFEGEAMAGGIMEWDLNGWEDYGSLLFPDESPPDIHDGEGLWTNRQPPANGKTYVGLVVRQNGTFEGISQTLAKSLKAGKKYAFSIKLCRPKTHFSPTKSNMQPSLYNFNTPVIFQIYGISGTEVIKLAETSEIKTMKWEKFKFKLKPKVDIESIVLRAYFSYKPYYNGALFIDDASHIIEKK